jgi:hypothetical protein
MRTSRIAPLSTTAHSLTHRLGLALLAALAGSGLAACSKTEKVEVKDQPAAAAHAPSAAKLVEPSAPAGGGATIEYTHTDPSFKLRLPAGFVANEPRQTGPGNTSMRFSMPGEDSGIGTFVSVTWWTKGDGTATQLRGQLVGRMEKKLDTKELAGGKGTFAYGTRKSQKMVEGKLADATEYLGSSVLEGATVVLTCEVATFEEPQRPAFVRACETLSAD